MPLMVQLMQRICATGGDARTATEWFLGLLVGDLQIRRVIGQLGAPSGPEIADRCAMALQALRVLLVRVHAP